MDEIYFVSGNAAKIEEVRTCIKRHGDTIRIVPIALSFPEIQSLSMQEVAIAKAKEAYNHVRKPLIVDDSGIFLATYPLFPGTLSKFVYEALGFKGIYALAPVGTGAEFRCCIVYIDGPESYHLFEGVCPGAILEESPHFDPNIPYCSIFAPLGYSVPYIDIIETVADEEVNHRYKAVAKFIAWYNENH